MVKLYYNFDLDMFYVICGKSVEFFYDGDKWIPSFITLAEFDEMVKEGVYGYEFIGEL